MSDFITAAVSAHVLSVTLDQAADEAFTTSAQAFTAAVDNGVTVRDLVAAIKAEAKVQGLTGLYSSAGSIGFHSRAGRVSLLDGNLPEGVTLRNVQTVIKNLAAKVADEAISSASTQAEALANLTAAAQAVADAAAEESSEEGEGEAEEVVIPKTALEYLQSAAGPIAKALALISDSPANVSEDTIALLASLQASLAEGSFIVSHQDQPVEGVLVEA